MIDSEHVKHIDDLHIGNDNNYIGIDLGIRWNEEGPLEHAVDKRRKTDIEGKPMGTYNKNPILDHSQYEVEYLDGQIETITANQIAENLLVQVDEEGRRQMFIGEIADHRITKEVIPKNKATYTTKSGRQKSPINSRLGILRSMARRLRGLGIPQGFKRLLPHRFSAICN